MPMPRDIKQLRSLLGGLSYYPKFLPNMVKRVRPITALLKKGATFSFTRPMEEDVRALLAGLTASPILVFLDWNAVIDKSRPFRLHCDASTDGLGATLEQEKPTVPSDPSSILDEKLSLMNGIGYPWNSKPDALYGASVAFAAIYLACSS